jgi:hypothetical protein
MYNRTPLEILEVDYSVSPAGVNLYEVYDTHEEYPMTPPVFESEDLTEAVRYCYNMGQDFTVRTLAQWYRENA